MDASPPTGSILTIRRGQSGWYVWSLQRALNALTGAGLGEDGVFGGWTENAVKQFQERSRLPYVDGLAGPQTQGRLGALAFEKVEAAHQPLPKGILHGLVTLESGNMLSVVNTAVSGGVDCGLVQRRVIGPPFSQSALKGAFSPVAACEWSVTDPDHGFIPTRDRLMLKTWAKGNRERAGRCAALNHNWPAGAAYYAEHGHAPSPTLACSWLPRNADGTSRVRFPDGARVETRQDWCEFYALGGKHGEGQASRFVTAW